MQHACSASQDNVCVCVCVPWHQAIGNGLLRYNHMSVVHHSTDHSVVHVCMLSAIEKKRQSLIGADKTSTRPSTQSRNTETKVKQIS